jgi:hypothetical protein
MTPEPKDFVRGARRTLADVVLPALADPFAIEQLKTVLRVLEHLEAVIDDAYPLESVEAEDLDRFLAAVAASGDSALSPLAADKPAAVAPAPYAELRAANVARKRIVADIVRALHGEQANPELAGALHRLLQKQLEREQRWTSPRRQAK